MELVIRNAKVWTVDPALPEAEAIAVRDGRIAAVGDDPDVRDAVGPGAEEVDAGGGTVLPGFIDAHNHLRLGSGEEHLPHPPGPRPRRGGRPARLRDDARRGPLDD